MRVGSAMSTPPRCSASTDSGHVGQKSVRAAMPAFGWKEIADEHARAADAARFERKRARERRLVARQNCMPVVPHAATLAPAALEAQREAAVEASRGGLPQDFLDLLPLP